MRLRFSRPTILVDGERWHVVPDTTTVEIPDGMRSRVASSGSRGQGVEAARTSTVRFQILNNLNSRERVRNIRAQGSSTIISLTHNEETLAWEMMRLMAPHEVNDTLMLVFQGRFVSRRSS